MKDLEKEAEQFHRAKLKEIGYKDEAIDELVDLYWNRGNYGFAASYANERVKAALEEAAEIIENQEYNAWDGKTIKFAESLKQSILSLIPNKE